MREFKSTINRRNLIGAGSAMLLGATASSAKAAPKALTASPLWPFPTNF
jgi:hypothetical protein